MGNQTGQNAETKDSLSLHHEVGSHLSPNAAAPNEAAVVKRDIVTSKTLPGHFQTSSVDEGSLSLREPGARVRLPSGRFHVVHTVGK